MTLDDLYEMVSDLIHKYGGETEAQLYNPLTDSMEEIEISTLEAFNPDSYASGDYLVIHPADFILEPSVGVPDDDIED